ncbi:MAG: hypothetical protein AB8B48_11795 [Pseudomonadales bacterium]
MMDAYTIGNLLGRLLLCIALVYVGLLIFAKLNFALSAKRLRHPVSLISIVALFILGVSVNAVADDSRALRPFITTEFSAPRLTVYIPERPEWLVAMENRSGAHALVLSTPQYYYPHASLEIIHSYRHKVEAQDLQNSAFIALNEVRKKIGVKSIDNSNLETVSYGQLQGYSDEFRMVYEGSVYSARSYFMIFESEAPVTIFLVASDGQIDHIDHMVEKILRNLSPLAEVDNHSL